MASRILAEVTVDAQRPSNHPHPLHHAAHAAMVMVGLAGFLFLCFHAQASVVIIRPAMEAASCKAMQTTLAGLMMPLEHVAALISLGVIGECSGSLLHDLADHDQAFDACILRDLWGGGDRSALRTILMPASRSSLSPLTVIALAAISSMTPPPGTKPSSTARPSGSTMTLPATSWIRSRLRGPVGQRCWRTLRRVGRRFPPDRSPCQPAGRAGRYSC